MFNKQIGKPIREAETEALKLAVYQVMAYYQISLDQFVEHVYTEKDGEKKYWSVDQLKGRLYGKTDLYDHHKKDVLRAVQYFQKNEKHILIQYLQDTTGLGIEIAKQLALFLGAAVIIAVWWLF